MRIGIEVGGTFTDLVAIDGDGIRVLKVPSTPHSPDLGAFAALEASGVPLDRVVDLAHGSTVATNAVLERKGFLTAFITTRGFRDILQLQRHGRTRVYDLHYRKPVPVVERSATFEVGERIPGEWPLREGMVLHLYAATLIAGEPAPLEQHDEIRWVMPSEFDGIDWLPSDVDAVRSLREATA